MGRRLKDGTPVADIPVVPRLALLTAAPRGPRPLRVLLRRPLLVGMAALTAVAVTTFGLAILVVTVLGGRVDRANETIDALQDGHIAMINQETSLRGFLVTREARFLEPYRKGAADLREANAALDRLGADDPELAERFAELRAAEERFLSEWLEPVLAEQPAIGDVAALSELLRRDKALFDTYRAVQGRVRDLVEERRADAYAQQRLVLLGGSAAGLVLTGFVAFAVGRANRRLAAQLLPPTREVRDTLAALSAGDVDVRATEAGPAELRDIAGDVNALGDALRDRNALVAAREQELVAARDQAERAGHAKTAFLATMSHEIRTPLNAVLGLTDLLLTTELTDEQRSHLETISGSGDSLLALINDILDFSKIEAGELDLERAPFALDGVVYDVAQLLAPQAAGKGLDLLVDIPVDRAWEVVGDAARLRQVVMNLVGNAVKFTAQGQVVVSVTGEADGDLLRCRIAVTDTGIGIPADQRHRLFRSFSQVDTSTTRSYGGTGLGLAISQRIVRAMGGDIDLESREGAGSTFTVAVDFEIAHVVPGPAVPEQALAGRRLLVVDDNATNLRIMEHQLTRYGAACVLVGSGAEALDRLERAGEAFDACLLDMHMPGMDGDECAERIRALPHGREVPLVLVSSSATIRPDTLSTFAARLHKPVRPERLLHTLRSVLQPGSLGAPGRSSRGEQPAGAGQHRLRVLVAEDNAVNAQLMDLYLRQLGHDGVHVGNGEEAVTAVLTGDYDVVLMDAQMPVLGGVDATAAIRAMPVRQPRIIAVTASVLAGDRAAFLAAGADDFLTKPVRMAVLRDALDSCRGQQPTLPVPPAAVDQPLDEETVEDLRDLGEGFAHLYRQYAGTLDASVAAIVAAAGSAWSEDDESSVPRLAHRLKGSSAALGALGMADLCRQLEELGPGPSAALDQALDRLVVESERVRTAVVDLLEREAAPA